MAFLKPDKVFDFGGVTVNEYLLTQHNPNKIDMPKTSMEGKVIGVTVHNTGWILVSSSTTPAEQYTRATVNGNMNDVRVHYYVDDVCAWQNLPLTLKGWHAADGQGNGNCRTVAIECIMSAKYNEKDKQSEDNCAKLAAALLKKFGLGINSLYTHSHWMNVRDGKKGTVDELNVMPNRTKNCPAYILPHWQQFKALVAKYLGEPISTQPTAPAKTEPTTDGKLSSLYRIRKTWEDAKSQIGAYTILNNAVNACVEGYSVFDLDGVVVFTNRGKSDKTNPYPEYKSTLRKGDKGDGVRWLQWELVDRGYNCGDTGVDGSFGGKTERGVKAFQEANGLDIDGVCGPMTRAAIEATAKHPVKPDFTPRYTKPEKGNPYYNTISNGGYSRAIKGKPTDPDCDVLANCFTGDTKIITRDGVQRLDSLEGKDVYVLTRDGEYRLAKGCYFGMQKMYEVRLNNGDSFVCTGNHRWLVRRASSWNGRKYEKTFFKQTTDLNGTDYIPYVKITDTSIERDGIIHGFIYGDGNYYNNYRSSQANLCGFKKEFMFEYFEDAKHIIEQANGVIRCYPYPKEYKEIPDISEKSLPYLRGFIAGLIASDGCVDKYGCLSISTVKPNDAKKISDILSVLGCRNKITAETRDTNYKKNSTLFRVLVKKAFVPAEIILNPKHQERMFGEEPRDISYTRVSEVIELDYEEDVYCVQEPETHTMVLDGCIVTGQCVGFAVGRFHEIAGRKQMDLVDPVNAENIFANAQKHGLKTGSTPKLGAMIVWQKGATLSGSDGAGHVAVVEEVGVGGEIVTSESGYGASKPFWNGSYKPPYNYKSGYTLLGFVYQPE